MRKLQVDYGDLQIAFDDASWEMNYNLDLETGRVVTVTESDRRFLDTMYKEVHGLDADQPVDLAEHIKNCDLPDWHKHTLLEADRIEIGYGSRCLGVPTADSHQGYRDREAFIGTVQDEELRAISGRGAFHYFKDVLFDYPGERQRWFDFKDERGQERILDWLAVLREE